MTDGLEVRRAAEAETVRLGVEAITEAVLRETTHFVGDEINTEGLRFVDACYSSKGFEHVLLEGVLVIPQDLATEGYLLGVARPGEVLINRHRRPIPAGCDVAIPAGGEGWCERATQYAEAVLGLINYSVTAALGVDPSSPSDPNG